MMVERAMPLGGSVTIDGEDVTEEMALNSYNISERVVLNIPETQLKDGVMFNDGKIYAACSYVGTGSNTYYNHFYVNDGSSWTQLSNLPGNAYFTRLIFFNNKLHIFWLKNHYEWDGSSWTQLGSLPFSTGQTSLLIYNNELHIIDSYYQSTSTKNQHYKWDGSSWTQVSTLPIDTGMYNVGVAVTYDNSIYYFYKTNAYRYSSETGTWSSAITGIVNYANQSVACAYKDKLYVGGASGSDKWEYYSVYDGENLTVVNHSKEIYDILAADDEIWIVSSDKKCTAINKKIYYKGWY